MSTNYPRQFTDFTIKWATLEWEKQQAYSLRQQVFCTEQNIFEETDKDEIDKQAHCLVAIANYGGWHDEIVGTVRIHKHENTWWGSRLAVHPRLRHHAGLASASIGSGLIRLAVSSAHALGCEEFLAHVQIQNEPLFQKLHWHSLHNVVRHNQLHVMMRADLAFYPPCFDPLSGYVIKGKQPCVPTDIPSPLLEVMSRPAVEARHVA